MKKLIFPILGLTVAVLFLCGVVISLVEHVVPSSPEDPSIGGERDTGTVRDSTEAGTEAETATETEAGTDPFATEGLFFEVKSDGAHVFLYKGSSDSVVIPSSYQGHPVTHIDAAAFLGRSIRSVTIPDTVIKIGQQAFSGCHELESMHIPDGVKYIDQGAFFDCHGLESVHIPDTVISIGQEAFFGCRGLESVHIPASVTRLEADSFRECVNLRSITVDEGNSVYRNVGNCLVELASGTVMVGFSDSVIPDDGTIRRIGAYAFHMIPNLTEIHIPASVEAIDNCAFRGCTALERVEGGEGLTEIGHSAFAECSALREITFHGKLKNIGSDAFKSCVLLETVEIPSSVEYMGGWAFNGCTNLREIIFHEGIKKMRFGAFGGTAIQSVTIPEGCTSIWNVAMGAEKLTTVYLPSTLEQIHDEEFSQCYQLKDIHFNGTKEQWLSITKKNLKWMEDVKSWTLHCTDGVSRWEWKSGSGMTEVK